MKSNKHSNENPVLGALRAIIIGCVIGAAFCAALLGVFSLAFVSAGNIPQDFISPLVIALSVLSAFLAGFITAKISKKRGLIYGMLSGVLLFLLFLLAGLAASQGPVSMEAGIRLVIMALAGAIGGFLGVNKKSK
ncbi:TIGR04086 family membrane protein [Caproiciproducens sp. LBM24188]|nr:TIGR04086 family membrane protein [Oscillospiraceae bacterium]HHV32595.1 TIGR04086 family membrane protein [Clostridiales bacterium]